MISSFSNSLFFILKQDIRGKPEYDKVLVNYDYNTINAQNNKANVKNKNSEKTIITNDYIIYDNYKTELINIEMPEKKK